MSKPSKSSKSSSKQPNWIPAENAIQPWHPKWISPGNTAQPKKSVTSKSKMPVWKVFKASTISKAANSSAKSVNKSKQSAPLSLPNKELESLPISDQLSLPVKEDSMSIKTKNPSKVIAKSKPKSRNTGKSKSEPKKEDTTKPAESSYKDIFHPMNKLSLPPKCSSSRSSQEPLLAVIWNDKASQNKKKSTQNKPTIISLKRKQESDRSSDGKGKKKRKRIIFATIIVTILVLLACIIAMAAFITSKQPKTTTPLIKSSSAKSKSTGKSDSTDKTKYSSSSPSSRMSSASAESSATIKPDSSTTTTDTTTSTSIKTTVSSSTSSKTTKTSKTTTSSSTTTTVQLTIPNLPPIPDSLATLPNLTAICRKRGQCSSFKRKYPENCYTDPCHSLILQPRLKFDYHKGYNLQFAPSHVRDWIDIPAYTPCEFKRWCINGECVSPRNPTHQNILEEYHRLPAINGSWGMPTESFCQTTISLHPLLRGIVDWNKYIYETDLVFRECTKSMPQYGGYDCWKFDSDNTINVLTWPVTFRSSCEKCALNPTFDCFQKNVATYDSICYLKNTESFSDGRAVTDFLPCCHINSLNVLSNGHCLLGTCVPFPNL